MKRWLPGGGVVGAGAIAVFACADLVGVRDDLTCAAPEGSPVDECIGEGGVAVLPNGGEIRGLAWTNATLVAVGYVQGTSTTFATQIFSADGAQLSNPLLDNPDGAASNGVAMAVVGTADKGMFVTGGNGLSFMLRDYSLVPSFAPYRPPVDFTSTQSEVPAFDGVALREAVAVVGVTLFGTTADGRLAVVRFNTKNITPNDNGKDAIFDAGVPLRATNGVADDEAGTITIVGHAPDAGPGLAMVRWMQSDPAKNIDTSFNDGGSLLATFGSNGSANALVNVPGDTSYWVGGQDPSGFVLTRVLSTGVIDASWTAAGSDRGINALLAIDGGLLAAGFADGNLAVARFTLDAGIDKTFGDAGVLEISLPGELKAIVQTDNHYVAGGFTTVNGTKQWVLVWLMP